MHAREGLPNKTRGKPCQISISLKTMKGVKMPPTSHREEHTITPRFLRKYGEAKYHIL